MTKILFIGATFSKNRGSAAMLISAIKTLRQAIPKSDFTVISLFPELDSKSCSIYKIRVIGYDRGALKISLKLIYRLFCSLLWKIFKSLGLDLHILLNEQLLREYINSDIVIDLSGDGFSDDYGVIASITSCYDILLCKLLNKPIVIYAQSIGPFNTKLTRLLSKFSLNRVDLLIVRDKITFNYLQEFGVTNKIYFTADSAFLLEAAPCEIVQDILLKENIELSKRPIIGISASQHIYQLEQKNYNKSFDNPYITLMVKIVNYLIDTFDAQVVFIPHVTNANNIIDDRFVAKIIYDMSKNKDKIKLINKEYSAEELKGIIGQCDLFIGARMHANIAATSMGIPTLAIAYSHKSYGIMNMLEMEKYVLDYRNMTFDEMCTKITDLWINREKIKEELASNVDVIKNRALYNGELVSDLINSMNKNQNIDN